MTDDPRESSFMMAAQKAIRDLQEQAEQHRRELDRARKDARMRKIQVRILGIVCAAVLVLSAFGIVLYENQQNATDQLRAETISSCQQSNSDRGIQEQVWNTFISLLLQGNTDPKAQAEGKKFEALVARANAPRPCEQNYSASPGN